MLPSMTNLVRQADHARRIPCGCDLYHCRTSPNVFRYASALLANQVTVNVFLLADGVFVAKSGQKAVTTTVQTCSGRSLRRTSKLAGRVARPEALAQRDLIEGVEMGCMADLARGTKESDSVVAF
jgi:sulfur relay (sulfurtransferase) complex TusBCD TusD component (DsrE family)